METETGNMAARAPHTAEEILRFASDGRNARDTANVIKRSLAVLCNTSDRLKNRVTNGDCMDYLPMFPEKYFALAVVDPPYGAPTTIKQTNRKNLGGANIIHGNARHIKRPSENNIPEWNTAPTSEYFRELRRVSRHLIVWGGNYFADHLGASRCWLSWVKKGVSLDFSMSSIEHAWTDFDAPSKHIEVFPGSRPPKYVRFHPSQKPIELYGFCLDFAERQMGGIRGPVLDTHAGSAGSMVACMRKGLDYIGFEVDAEYCAAAERRLYNIMNHGIDSAEI